MASRKPPAVIRPSGRPFLLDHSPEIEEFTLRPRQGETTLNGKHHIAAKDLPPFRVSAYETATGWRGHVIGLDAVHPTRDYPHALYERLPDGFETDPAESATVGESAPVESAMGGES